LGEGCVTGANGVSRESVYSVKSIFTNSHTGTPVIASVYALISPVLPNSFRPFAQPVAFTTSRDNNILWFCCRRTLVPFRHFYADLELPETHFHRLSGRFSHFRISRLAVGTFAAAPVPKLSSRTGVFTGEGSALIRRNTCSSITKPRGCHAF
jgi:hypothetical protein